MTSWAALVLFLVVLVLIIWQPRGLSIGWPAAVGGGLAVVLGIVTLSDVMAVVGIVWDATLAFVAIIIISLVLDRAGFFEWAALHMARAARGNGKRMFLYSALLGAVVAMFFANDGAALILTPILYEQAKALRLPPASLIAFVMAGGFIADTTSLPLVISNLVNIVSADFFHIGFLHYAAAMLPVDVVALLASVIALYLFYRRSLPAEVSSKDLPAPETALHDPALFRDGIWLLGLLFLGYLLSGILHFPVSIPAMLVAGLLLLRAQRSSTVQVREILREAPWKIVVFSLGMYIVVYGLRDAGLTSHLSAFIMAASRHSLALGILGTGFLAGIGSSILNNMPMVMVNALAIHGTGVAAPIQQMLGLANVVGCDLGPKLTPIGSLATLLWLHVLERRGLRISWGYYIRVGVTLTLPVLAVTLLALVGVLQFVH